MNKKNKISFLINQIKDTIDNKYPLLAISYKKEVVIEKIPKMVK